MSEEDDFDFDSDDELESDVYHYGACDDYFSSDIPDDDLNEDPEKFSYELLQERKDVKNLLDKDVQRIQELADISASVARLLLRVHFWNIDKILNALKHNSKQFLIDSRVMPISFCQFIGSECPVCFTRCHRKEDMKSMLCGHTFCIDCWIRYLTERIEMFHGFETRFLVTCMGHRCEILVGEDFMKDVLTCLTPALSARWSELELLDEIDGHPKLRLCPNSRESNCTVVSYAEKIESKLVECKCGCSYCFKCGSKYHAPTTCEILRQWEKKCRDDSETSNYLQANTKDCPNCHICIEKNGGCNHMQCYKCKHDFCWMCLGSWRTHNQEYYECSKYRENPHVVKDAKGTTARLALQKYIFYYERWSNHERSLNLEKEHMEKLQRRIKEKTLSNDGTWIDWQDLVEAAKLLNKARYTLQYTYPHAYYIGNQHTKELFEYRQGELERDVEELAWKVEHCELQDKAQLALSYEKVKRAREAMLREFFAERFVVPDSSFLHLTNPTTGSYV